MNRYFHIGESFHKYMWYHTFYKILSCISFRTLSNYYIRVLTYHRDSTEYMPLVHVLFDQSINLLLLHEHPLKDLLSQKLDFHY